jgi:outer membrane protein OmpA-like peptidoglycan-associated protein
MSFLQITAQSDHADCLNALYLKEYDMEVGPLEGYGSELEIFGNRAGDALFITEEHNTVWISFKSPYNAELTFDIVPANIQDDWDFMLFEAGSDFCQAVALKSIKPLRSNLAKNEGKTGLGADADQDFVPAGSNNNFSRKLEVERNKAYMLLIDIEESSQSGFQLIMHYKEIQPEILIEEKVAEDGAFDFVDMSEESSNDEVVVMNFQILNKATGEALLCEAHIVGIQWEEEEMRYDSTSSFTAAIPMDKWFYVNVKKPGFTFGTEKFKAARDLEGITQTIYLSEVKKGNKIVLNEIVFRENTTHLLPSSINALEQLIQFMNEYPTAKIEIQGHVNAPGFDNDGKVKKFSLKRAEQIKEYLVAEGIEGRRMEVRGLGNEHMLYPNPSTYDEEKANRRVEIEILSY